LEKWIIAKDVYLICMKKTRTIIDNNKENFYEFDYYHNILDKIEENIEKMPDICIESCKSLIEGVSKTILNKLNISYVEKGRNADTPRDLFKKAIDNIPVTISHDSEFVFKVCDLVSRMTEIRNKSGDISHGRSSPKEIESDKNLAIFISEITDSLAFYLLNIYFKADLSYIKGIDYDENIEFNAFLDSKNDNLDIIYSRALFDQDPVLYEEQLNNYLLENDSLK